MEIVIPAKAGIQNKHLFERLDSNLRWDDNLSVSNLWMETLAWEEVNSYLIAFIPRLIQF